MNLSLFSRYASAFLSYSRGKTILSYPPLFYSIEATNLCNFQCRYCPQRYEPHGSDDGLRKGRMNVDLFESILKRIVELRPISRLYLTGTGEPLLHPQLEKFISLSNQYGFVPSFSSNGSLFFPERSKSLLNSGKFLLTVDFSPSKNIYEDYRCGGNWETVYDNLKNLLALKRESGKGNPQIEIRDMSPIAVHSVKDKEESLSELRRMFVGLPVERFSQLKPHRWIGNIDRNIRAAKSKGRSYKLCTHPWSIFVIAWNGEVVACCRDFGCQYVVGRMDGQSRIMDIWNNEKMQHLRKALVAKKPQDIVICKDCDRPTTGGSVARSKSQMIRAIFWDKIASRQ
jgi:radical SAM protein with 4Fe4S-binding SPASM domain